MIAIATIVCLAIPAIIALFVWRRRDKPISFRSRKDGRNYTLYARADDDSLFGDLMNPLNPLSPLSPLNSACDSTSSDGVGASGDWGGCDSGSSGSDGGSCGGSD